MDARRVAQYNVRICRGGHVCMSKIQDPISEYTSTYQVVMSWPRALLQTGLFVLRRLGLLIFRLTLLNSIGCLGRGRWCLLFLFHDHRREVIDWQVLPRGGGGRGIEFSIERTLCQLGRRQPAVPLVIRRRF